MPRLVVSGLSGGAGKTTVSLGLVRAFTRQDIRVHPFKKGPDYIDTAWLALAAKGRASTLDPFFCDEAALRRHFASRSAGADLAVIEGNRGLFDGRDLEGSASTAEVARQLDAPVVLVVDITKMTRTTSALVAGCRNFPGGERIAGVILNRAGTDRHAAIARRAVEELAGVPVFGVLPRLDCPPIPERRAGLVTVTMPARPANALETQADVGTD
ncbi:MAG: AAA family ATPase, partial [Deltaproteobacteria bacterium]|nr:AAA family ATPase [Deltaproteobacteria bacterium]